MTRLKLTVCPNCGNKNLKKVRKTVTGTRQGKRYSAPSVEFYECPDCGERVYDSSAIQQIEQHSHTAAGQPAPRRPPIKIKGKPISETIVEDRR